MSSQDDKFMLSALKLAKRGIGSVEPNPAVGCIVVKGNQAVGKGWHKKFGEAHAEINALEDCKSLGVEPKGSTMYVTFEPCCHQGKTGPCTDAIIEAKPAKVIVAMIDPSENVNGKGVEQLRNAGIEVVTGVCQTKAKLLNGPFIKFAKTGKTWVTLKWAQSIDGKLAWADQETEQKWISNEQSRKDAHLLRLRCQAILVGINTVLIDDPLLTPRPSKGKKPTRIVLDSHLRIPLDSQLLKTANKTPVLILTSEQTVRQNPQIAEQVAKKGAELLVFGDISGQSNLPFLMEQLSSRGITQLLVEGGPTVIASFIKENLVDEVCVYIAPKLLGGLGAAGINKGIAELNKVLELHYVSVKTFDDDIHITGLTNNALESIGINET